MNDGLSSPLPKLIINLGDRMDPSVIGTTGKTSFYLFPSLSLFVSYTIHIPTPYPDACVIFGTSTQYRNRPFIVVIMHVLDVDWWTAL